MICIGTERGRLFFTSGAPGFGMRWATSGHEGKAVTGVDATEKTTAISSGEDGSYRMWRVQDRAPHLNIQFPGPLRDVKLSRKSVWAHVACTTDSFAVDPYSGKIYTPPPGVATDPDPAEAIGSHQTQQFVAVAGLEGRLLRIMDARLHSKHVDFVDASLGYPHERSIRQLSLSGDCSLLVSGSEDGTVKLWDVGSGGMISQLRFGAGQIPFPQFREGHSTLVIAASRELQIFRPAGKSMMESVVNVGHSIKTFAYWPSSREVLSAVAKDDKTRPSHFFSYQLHSQSRVQDFNGVPQLGGGSWLECHPTKTQFAISSDKWKGVAYGKTNSSSPDAWLPLENPGPVAYSPNGKWVVALGAEPDEKRNLVPLVKLWSEGKWQVEGKWRAISQTAMPSPSTAYCLTAGNTTLAAAFGGPEIQMFDIPGLKPGHKFVSAFSVSTLALSPNERFLAVGDMKGHVTLYDLATSGSVSQESLHRDAVTSMAWRPDGTLLVTAGADQSLAFWSVAEGRLQIAARTQLPSRHIVKMLLTPDGKDLLTLGANEVAIRDWQIEELLRVLVK
ncbi:MAG: WD40 repeat domain-containing protein [Pirellulaceae bacterium]|nr:WD40 repeat domain-containing protein [Pirellulaceae bacterium]